MTNERSMVDSIGLLHERPLGKSDHSVLVIKFICYAELVNIKRMKYYYDRGDYEANVNLSTGMKFRAVIL